MENPYETGDRKPYVRYVSVALTISVAFRACHPLANIV